MKKIISLALCAVTVVSTLASCVAQPQSNVVRAIGSSAETSAEWLSDRLGDTSSTDILLAPAEDAERFDIDMSTLRDEGYVIRSQGDDVLILGKTDKGLDRGVRYYANHCVGVGALDITYGEGYRVKSLTIAGHDISEYSIYLFPGADACHTFAAEELQKYIGLACGTTLPIVSEKSGRVIEFEQRLADPELGDEGFILTVDENADLHIIGGKYRGCMYGVYEFLERYIGWRFFFNWQTDKFNKTTEDASIYYLYESDHIDISADLNDKQTPSFAYRQGRNPFTSNDYNVKIKDNRQIANKKHNRYGDCTCTPASHGVDGASAAGAFSTYNFQATHKQPCYTDETFLEEAEEYFVGYVEKQIEAGKIPGYSITEIDVGQCDTFPADYCTCKNCMKVQKEEKSFGGPVLRFTNRMADAIGAKWPELWVGMLSYAGTTTPCVTPPRDNVNIGFCFYIDPGYRTCCGNHSINGENCNSSYGSGVVSNKTFAEDLKKWCEIAKRVTCWYYPCNWEYSALSYATFQNIREDFKFLHDCGIHGTWVCTYDPKKAASREPIDQLTLYVLQRCLWNAEMSEEEFDQMVTDYLNVLYEDSGAYMKQLYDWVEYSQTDMCIEFNQSLAKNPLNYFRMETVRDDFDMVLETINTALRVAPTERVEKGIRLASRTFYWRGLIATYYDWYLHGTDEQKAHYTEIYNYFRDLAVSTSYALNYITGGKPNTATIPLVEEDFDISKNPGTLYDKYFIHFKAREDGWYDWREK